MGAYAPRAARGGGTGAPALVALLAIVALAGAGAWLWVVGPETLPAAPVAVTVSLPPPLAPPLPPAAALAPLPAPVAPPGPVAPPAPVAAAPIPVPEPTPKPAAKPAAKTALAPPLPELIERGKTGPLPRVAVDGRKPWRVYARPFDRGDARPRIAVVIDNLGLSGAATQAAIQDLPGEITLAFSPYSTDLGADIPLARAAGHEVLLGIPMEPVESGGEAGPQALKTGLTEPENLARLDWMMSRVAGYVGVTDFQGGRFMASTRDLRPILMAIKKRGLMFFDSRDGGKDVGADLAAALGIPVAAGARVIDRVASRDAIDAQLLALEREARRTGRGIVLGFPYPVTLERIGLWARTLPSKGIALAPVSAMVPLPQAAEAEGVPRG